MTRGPKTTPADSGLVREGWAGRSGANFARTFPIILLFFDLTPGERDAIAGPVRAAIDEEQRDRYGRASAVAVDR